jgi:hypothetical protein
MHNEAGQERLSDLLEYVLALRPVYNNQRPGHGVMEGRLEQKERKATVMTGELALL